MSIKKITGYTIYLKHQLGKGSYGSVYRGQQDKTKAVCAIKMLSKKNSKYFANLVDSDQYLKSALLTQINVLKSVKSQNIVGFLDVMESSQNYYIVQELCDGDLQKLLKEKGGKLPEQQAIDILKQISNGFLALVRQGIVHRDLKPANLMLSKGIIKLGDFGFAKKSPNQRFKNQTAVGTPLYMCIQILKGQPYTSKCDIWALGFIFYEMLHGYTPWVANTEFELVRNIQNKPLKINPNLSLNTKDFLEKALKIHDGDRISWDNLFLHPIFNNYFHKFAEENQAFENKMKKVMSDLRFMINSQNIDLKNLFDKKGFKANHQLKFQEFSTLMRDVNPNISGQQVVYIFQKLDTDNTNSISLKQLQMEMQKNNINLRSRFIQPMSKTLQRTFSVNQQQKFTKNDNSMNEALLKKVKTCFVKLYNALNYKKMTLYNAFCIYDIDKSGGLTLGQFGKIMKRLDGSISEQQTQILFDFIDTDQSKTIQFDQLNNYYCKINGLPVEMDLPQQYKMIKMQQNNPYYKQMKQNNGNGQVMNKIKESFNKNEF